MANHNLRCRKQAYANLANIEIYELWLLMCYVATEISAHKYVPPTYEWRQNLAQVKNSPAEYLHARAKIFKVCFDAIRDFIHNRIVHDQWWWRSKSTKAWPAHCSYSEWQRLPLRWPYLAFRRPYLLSLLLVWFGSPGQGHPALKLSYSSETRTWKNGSAG